MYLALFVAIVALGGEAYHQHRRRLRAEADLAQAQARLTETELQLADQTDESDLLRESLVDVVQTRHLVADDMTTDDLCDLASRAVLSNDGEWLPGHRVVELDQHLTAVDDIPENDDAQSESSEASSTTTLACEHDEEMVDLERQILELEGTKGTLASTVRSLKSQNGRLDSAKSVLELEKSRVESRLASAQSKHVFEKSSLLSEISSLQSQLASSQQTAHALEALYHDLQEKLKKLEREHAGCPNRTASRSDEAPTCGSDMPTIEGISESSGSTYRHPTTSTGYGSTRRR